MKNFSAMRGSAAALLSLALVVTVSACSSGSQPADDDGQPLEVWTRTGPDAAKTYEKIFDAFTEKTGIEVNYQAVQEFDTQLAARASEKDLPDVLINDAGSLGNYVAQGFLVPIDRDSISGSADVSDESWEQNTALDGEIYGIPWSRQANATIIRKDWREKLGLPQPTTWQELSELANAFATQDPDGDGQADTYGMVVPGSAKNGYLARWGNSYVWQAGGDFIEQNDDGTYSSVIASSETAEAMEWMRTQFCTPGTVVPGSLNLTTAETPFFQEGTAGIYLTGGYNLGTFDAAVGKENVEVVPMPAGPEGTTTFAEGENIYFGATSTKSDQQTALAEYLISPEAQVLGMDVVAEGSDAISYPVVRLPVNTTVDVGTELNDPRWNVIADSYSDDSKPFPWNIDFNPYRQIIADGMNVIMSDCDGDITAGLDAIDSQLTAELQAQGLAAE